jgi:hypothetical protein
MDKINLEKIKKENPKLYQDIKNKKNILNNEKVVKK